MKCYYCEDQNHERSVRASEWDGIRIDPAVLLPCQEFISNTENTYLPDSNHLEQSFQDTWDWVEAQRANSFLVRLEVGSQTDTSNRQNVGSDLQSSAITLAGAEKGDLKAVGGDSVLYAMPEEALGSQYQSTAMEYSVEHAVEDHEPHTSAVDRLESRSSVPKLVENDGEAGTRESEDFPSKPHDPFDSFSYH